MRIKLDNRELIVHFRHDPRVTTAFIDIPPWPAQTSERFTGQAVCSISDNFSKVVGRKIALARALKHFSREDRREIWRQLIQQGMRVAPR